MPLSCGARCSCSVAFCLVLLLPLATFGSPINQNYISAITSGSGLNPPELAFINPATGNVTSLCYAQYPYMTVGAVLPGYDNDVLVFFASQMPGSGFLYYTMPSPVKMPLACSSFLEKRIPGPNAIQNRYGVELGVFFTESAPPISLQTDKNAGPSQYAILAIEFGIIDPLWSLQLFYFDLYWENYIYVNRIQTDTPARSGSPFLNVAYHQPNNLIYVIAAANASSSSPWVIYVADLATNQTNSLPLPFGSTHPLSAALVYHQESATMYGLWSAPITTIFKVTADNQVVVIGTFPVLTYCYSFESAVQGPTFLVLACFDKNLRPNYMLFDINTQQVTVLPTLKLAQEQVPNILISPTSFN